ncbi:MAG: cytochrome C [Hyphomicrobiales bacterium]|nr:MAG: cytochrome C [Hyphomicrobiales bacterium]
MMNKIKDKFMPTLLVGVLVGGIAVIAFKNTGGSSGYSVPVKTVKLSRAAKEGEIIFNASCASCHGVNASGTESGPPLIHKIYEPSHHGDAAFLMAPKRGVRAHHWPYGNMPPVEGITDQHTRKIVRYVRELQRANGIL